MSSPAAWLQQILGWSDSRQSRRERLSLLGLAAAAIVLLTWGRGLTPAGQVVLWSGLALAAAVVARRGWLRLLGPVFFFDLLCTARRRRYFVVRVLYAGFLLLVLSWVYYTWTFDLPQGSAMDMNQASLFASTFFYTFMVVQFLIVTLVTPAYVGGTIAEEKERRTLEFLLATDLRDREIVLSKLLSRLLNLVLLLLTGLPVLAALQFLGGVDPGLVLAGFGATALSMASLAGLSIYNSTVCRRARDAIVLTYLMALLYLTFSGMAWMLLWPEGWDNWPSTTTWTSPFTVRDGVEWLNIGNIFSVLAVLSDKVAAGSSLDSVLPSLFWKFAAFHGVVAVLGPALAVLRLRPVALREMTKTASRGRSGRRPPRAWGLSSQPMLWKEVFADKARPMAGRWTGRILAGTLIVASVAPTLIILGAWIDGHLHSAFGSTSDVFSILAEWINLVQVRIAGTAVACMLLVAVAVRAAGSLSGERDRQTLDTLLTTSLDSDAILFGKWLGSILAVRRSGLWLAVIGLVGLVTGGLHPLALPLLGVTWLVFAGFASVLGLGFSLICRTTMRATIWTLLAMVGAMLGHWAIWLCCLPLFVFGAGPAPSTFETIYKVQVGLTPPFNLGGLLCFTWRDFQESPGNPESVWELVVYAALGALAWAILTAVLWAVISVHFRQASGRSPLARARLLPRRRRRSRLSAATPAAAQGRAMSEQPGGDATESADPAAKP